MSTICSGFIALTMINANAAARRRSKPSRHVDLQQDSPGDYEALVFDLHCPR